MEHQSSPSSPSGKTIDPLGEVDYPGQPPAAHVNKLSSEAAKQRPSLATSTTRVNPRTAFGGAPVMSLDEPAWELENYQREPAIEKLHDKDDIDHVATWQRVLYHSAPIFSMASIGAYWTYFAFRIKTTLKAQLGSGEIYYMGWVFIVLEMAGAFPMLLHQAWSCFMVKHRRRPKIRLVGDRVPTVDAFITCCGEETDVILDTVRAACDVDYPANRFRVILLDDGGSAELSAQVTIMQGRYSNLYYTARKKAPGVPHHYKAGNLNHGLDYVKQLEGGPAEYIAALDADMIPEKPWLRTVVAHLVMDPELAMSCPPQLFYNVPTNDPLLQSLNVLVDIWEPVKDSLGVAWCTGSGYAVRRCAIEEIGGFAIDSLAEDVCTSSMLLGAGWKTAYIHEALQYGMVPDSFVGHLRQRTRWIVGTIQTTLKLRFYLFGPLVRNMTLPQRLSGLLYSISSYFTIIFTAALFSMPIVLISGGVMVAYDDYDQLRWLIRLCFIALAVGRLDELILFSPASYRLGLRESRTMVWMAPYLATSVIRVFFLPRWLGGSSAGFSPTGSIANELHERDRAQRQPLFRRLKAVLWDCRAGLHLLYILFCLAAATLSSVRCVVDRPSRSPWSSWLWSSSSSSSSTNSNVWICLLTHAFWPPVLWSLFASACWVPIQYALWPPTMPDREELLERDPSSGVAHPKQRERAIHWSKKNYAYEAQYSLLTLYTAVLFFGTFFF